MARIWSSGFELNSTTAGIEWITQTLGSPTISSTTYRSGAYAFRVSSLTSATNMGFRQQYISSETTGNYYFRFYFRAATLPSAANRIAIWNDSTSANTTPGVYITLDNSGVLRLYDEDGQITGTTTISTGTWYRIEMHYDTTAAGGSQTVEARVDGTNFASASNRNIASTNGPYVMTLGGNLNSEAQTTGDWFFDDVAINDNSGSFQNSWPGEGEIIHLKPNNTGDTSGYTGDYTAIDEVTPNDATDTITANTAQTEEVNLEATPAGMASDDIINCVQVGIRYTASAVNVSNYLRIKASASGTTEETSAFSVVGAGTYQTNLGASGNRGYRLTLYDLPGASTTAWTKNDLDNAQIGVRTDALSGGSHTVSTLWLLVDHKPSPGPSLSITEDGGTPGEVVTVRTSLNISVADSTTPSEVLCALSTQDSVALKSYGSYGSWTESVLTFSLNNRALNNPALIVGVGLRGAASVSSIAFGAQSLTQIGRYAPGGDVCVEMWILYNPNPGTYDLVTTLNTTQTCFIVAGCFDNVDSVTGYGDTDFDSVLPGTSIDVSPDTWAGYTVVDMVMEQANNYNLAQDASQTLVTKGSASHGYGGMSYKASSHGTTTMTWTSSNEYMAQYAVAIRPIQSTNKKISVYDSVYVSDSNKRVVVPPVGADQWQTETDYSWQTFSYLATSSNKVAQSFQPSITGTISQVTVRLLKEGSPTDNVVLGIYSDNSNQPGTLLDSDSVAGTTITGSEANYTFNVSVSCTADTKYWIVLSSDNPSYNQSDFYYAVSGFNYYSRGDYAQLDSSWTIYDYIDLYFIEYTDEVLGAVNINVSDGASPGEVVTPHIPQNYISVQDAAGTPGEVVTAQIPKNYVSVQDAASPGETIAVRVPSAPASVLDTAAPGEVASVRVSDPRISVLDSASPGEVINPQPLTNDKIQTSEVTAMGFGNNTYHKMGQKWHLGFKANLAQIQVKLNKTGTPTDNLTLKIWTVAADGYTPNTLLATADNTINGTDVASGGGYHYFNFDVGDCVLDPGYYCFTLERSGAYDASHYYGLYAAISGSSPTGGIFLLTGTDDVWTSATLQARFNSLVYASTITGYGIYPLVESVAAPGEVVSAAAISPTWVDVSVVDNTAPTEVVNVSVPTCNISVLDSTTPTEAITAQIPQNYVSVIDAASPGEAASVAVSGPRVSVVDNTTPTESINVTVSGPKPSVLDTASPGENITVAVSGPKISVQDSTTPTEVIAVTASSPRISVIDSTTPTEVVNLYITKLFISVLDSAQPGDTVTAYTNAVNVSVSDGTSANDQVVAHIPQNYISVTDTASPGEEIAIYAPSVYINVTDATAPGEVINAQVPLPGIYQINVYDAATPGEVISTYIPRLYQSVFDAATPGENITVAVSSSRVSVQDAAAPGDTATVRVSGPRINVSDGITAGDTLAVSESSPRVSVSDSASPGDTVTVQIPKYYINVNDGVVADDVVTAHVPKYYINVTDGTAADDVANISLPLVSYVNVSVTDSAQPGEVVNAQIPFVYISVLDQTAPQEVVNLVVNNLAIVVIDSLAAGEVVNLQPSEVPWYDIVVVDVARPGDKRKVAKSHTGIGPKNPRDWYDEAPQPFQTKNTGGWYADNPKPYKSKNTPDWYEKY